MDCSLEGKLALITGGGGGIGRAAALGFARAGADVVIASRKIENLEKVAGEIRGMGRKSLAIAAHLGRMEDVKSLVAKTVEAFGRIDILVNNAGTSPSMAPALDFEERAWDSLINLNLKGTFFLSQAVARVMKEKGGGSIINVASTAGLSPRMLTAYSISKAGVIMATKGTAREWAKYGIRVNVVAPGLVKTRFSEAIWSNPEAMKKEASEIPMGRLAEPEEVVGTMIYLASDASRYVTGAVITIDGGWSI